MGAEASVMNADSSGAPWPHKRERAEAGVVKADTADLEAGSAALRSKIGVLTSRFVVILLLAVVMTTALTGLGELAIQSSAASAATRTVNDMAGREHEVPVKPERIAALGAGMMRKMAYFNAVDRVVGVEEIDSDPDNFHQPYQLANPELLELPLIGPTHGGDAELIAGEDPEVVLFQGDPEEARTLERKLEVPVVNFDFGDLYNERTTFYRALELLGEVLDRPERSADLREYIEGLISDLDASTADVPADEKPPVLAGGMSYRGAHGFTSVRVPFPPFEFVNARDVAGRHLDYETMTQVSLSRELLLDWDPELIFVDLGNIELVRSDVKRHPEYAYLSAVENGRVYGFLPYAHYHVNFASVLANSYYAGSVIYPERFGDIDPAQQADEIYQFMLGEEIYRELSEHYGGFGAVEL